MLHPSSLARLCQPVGLQQSKLLVGFPVCALQAGALSCKTPVLLAGSPSSLSLSQSDCQWLSPQMLCDSHGAKPEQEFPEVTPNAGGAGCQPCALLCPWRSCRQGATLGKGPCGQRVAVPLTLSCSLSRSVRCGTCFSLISVF